MTPAYLTSADLHSPYVDQETGPGEPYTAEQALVDIGATPQERAAVLQAAAAVHAYVSLMAEEACRPDGRSSATLKNSADAVLDRLLPDVPLRRKTRLLGVASDLAREQGAARSFVKAGTWRKNLERKEGAA